MNLKEVELAAKAAVRDDFPHTLYRMADEIFHGEWGVVNREAAAAVGIGRQFTGPATTERFAEPNAGGLIRGTQVVIDMQSKFLNMIKNRGENPDEVVNNVGRVIDLAKQKNLDILVVEYGTRGMKQTDPTIPAIADRVLNYERAKTIQKFGMAGGAEIDDALAQHRLFPCVAQFSGIFAKDCVVNSATRLHEFRPMTFIEQLNAATDHNMLRDPFWGIPNMRFVTTPIKEYT